ncbi:MAG: hypothetical protein AB1405_02750, partial [Bdellovibrionota bacterium]
SAYVFMGVEAADDAQREKLKKIYKQEEAENAFRLFREADIATQGSWIIGFPWDTLESIESAFQWISTLPMDFLSVLFAAPFGSTPLREYVEQNGLLLTDDSNYFNVNEPTIRTPDIPIEILKTLPGHYLKRYHFTPRYFAHVAARILRRPSRLFVVADLLFRSFLKYRTRQTLPEGRRRAQEFAVPAEFWTPLDSIPERVEFPPSPPCMPLPAAS